MVVTSGAKDGRDEEYNAWYDGTHLADILSLDGVTSGRRYDATSPSPHPQPAPYLAIYEIEADDPGTVLAELTRRAEAGEFSLSDALNAEQAKIWMYKAH